MALPKIDYPIYEITLPLSEKHIRFRPFLVKEQRNLLMALESNDKDTIEKNIKQVLHNCTLTTGINIEQLPIIDVEFYFLNLRARSVGEVIESKYKCENLVNATPCGNIMTSTFNLLDIVVTKPNDTSNVIELTNDISIKFKYPEFSILDKANKFESMNDVVFSMIVESVDYIYDGEQFFYAKESSPAELIEFIESLNQEQFSKIQEFFENLPKLNKTVNITCSKCGHNHNITMEGLENFFV